MLPETSFSFLFSISRREINDVCFSLIVFLALQQFHSLPRCYVFVFFFPVACTSCTAPCWAPYSSREQASFCLFPRRRRCRHRCLCCCCLAYFEGLEPSQAPFWCARAAWCLAVMDTIQCSAVAAAGLGFSWGLWTCRMELLFWKCKNPSLTSTLGPGVSIAIWIVSITRRISVSDRYSSWDQHFSGKLLQTRRWNPRFIFCNVVALFFWIFHKPLYVVKGEIFLYFLISLNYWFL